ncbi:MAG: DnaJ domain-containing protein [Thermodesulfobacteriota bacterium]
MGPKRALIVGSDEDQCIEIQAVLDSKGVSTTVVLNYKDGLDKLFYEKPDLAVLELISTGFSQALLKKINDSKDYEVGDYKNKDSKLSLNPIFIVEQEDDIDSLTDYLKHSLTDGGTKVGVSTASIQGELKGLYYPRILVNLFREKNTGILTVDTKVKLKVYFINGVPVFAEGGELETALGRMLLDSGKIGEEDYEKALDKGVQKGQRIGYVLIEMGLISPHELNSLLEHQVKEKIVRGFNYTRGTFSFQMDDEFINSIIAYQINPLQLIYEGVKRFVQLPDLEKIFFIDKGGSPTIEINTEVSNEFATSGLSPKELRFIHLLKDKISVADIISSSRLELQEALALIYFLYLLGYLKIQSIEKIEETFWEPFDVVEKEGAAEQKITAQQAELQRDGSVESVSVLDDGGQDPSLTDEPAEALSEPETHVAKTEDLTDKEQDDDIDFELTDEVVYEESPIQAPASVQSESVEEPAAEAGLEPGVDTSEETPVNDGHATPTERIVTAESSPVGSDVEETVEEILQEGEGSHIGFSSPGAQQQTDTADDLPEEEVPVEEPSELNMGVLVGEKELVQETLNPEITDQINEDVNIIGAQDVDKKDIGPDTQGSVDEQVTGISEQPASDPFQSPQSEQSEEINFEMLEPQGDSIEGSETPADEMSGLVDEGQGTGFETAKQTTDDLSLGDSGLSLEHQGTGDTGSEVAVDTEGIDKIIVEAFVTEGRAEPDQENSLWGDAAVDQIDQEISDVVEQKDEPSADTARSTSETAPESDEEPVPKSAAKRALREEILRLQESSEVSPRQEAGQREERAEQPEVESPAEDQSPGLSERQQQIIDEINEIYPTLEDRDYYQILGLEKDTIIDDIKASYFILAKEFHPDRSGFLDDESKRKAGEIFVKILNAYETLSDTNRRAEYDESDEEEIEAAREQMKDLYEAEIAYKEGELLLKRKNYGKAMDYMQKALMMNPDEAAYLAALYWTKFLAAPKKESITSEVRAQLEKACNMNPKCSEAYYYLGCVHKHNENMKQAEKNFAKAVECKPDFLEAKRELWLMQRRKPKKDKKKDKKFLSGIFKK